MSNPLRFLCFYLICYFTVGHLPFEAAAGRVDSAFLGEGADRKGARTRERGFRFTAPNAPDAEGTQEDTLLMNLRHSIEAAKKTQEEMKEARRAQRAHLLRAAVTVFLLWRFMRLFFRCFWAYIDGHP